MFESLPQSSDRLINDPPPSTEWRGFVKLGWFALVFGFGIFLIWSVSAPLDKGVAVTGAVTVSGQRMSVQAPTAGIIEKVFVKEGQQVIAGEPLFRIQSPQSDAVAGAALASYTLAALTKERLLAELANRSVMSLPDELKRYAASSSVQMQLATQQRLLQGRLASRDAELSAIKASIEGLKLQQASFNDSLHHRLREAALLEVQQERIRSLVIRGFASAAGVDEIDLKRARANSEVAEIQGQLDRIGAQLTESRLNLSRREAEYRQETKARLLEAERDFETYKSQLNSAEINVGYTEVNAPATGSVLGLLVPNPSVVVSNGQQLLNIVPADTELSVEAQIPIQLIDQVVVGLPVELMFPAFQQNKTPRLTGVVTTVGADSLTDNRTGLPYYPVNINMDKGSASKLSANKIRPGMPVEVFIRAGERTFASYLLKPIVDRLQGAIAEE